MAYDNPFQDPTQQPNGITAPNNPAGQYPPPPTIPGGTAQMSQAPAQPAGGYDLEKFRKAWYGKGDVNNIQGWLDQNKDFTSGVTLKNEKAYDPSGRYIADLVGNYNNPNQARTAIFLDGVGSNGKPRTPKVPPKGITPPGPGNLPPTTTKPPVAPPPTTPPVAPGASVAPVRDPRLDELYNTLMQRAQQGTNIDRNNPIIRAQADAFSANEERSRRNYLSDLAEKSGPNANLRNEARMSAEKVGQSTGGFEAELMGRELGARRQEISEALNSAQGLLTEEQRLALQNELTRLNDATQRFGIQTQDKQYYAGLGQNQRQFDKNLGFQRYSFDQDLGYRNRALDQSDNQFRDRLGFDYADRSNYWDSLYRGAQ